MRTPFGTVDASWLRMDDPANHMIVTGVLVLEDEVPTERVRRLVRERLCRFDRFRQRAVAPRTALLGPTWEDDPDFSVDAHVREVRLEGAADEAALQAFVSRLLAEPFPQERPLWQVFFIPRYRGGSAIVTRIHHCIADGHALIHVLLSLADGPSAVVAAPRPAPRANGSNGSSRLAGLAAEAAAHLGALAELLLLPPDPLTPLKGPLTVEKKVAWSRPFRLDDFKAVGRVTGSTVNDILVAALAGGLRRYLLDAGEVAPGLDVRGVVPVDLRPPGEAHLLGNRFGLVFLPLPLGIEDSLDRLFEVRSRMRALKRSRQAPAIFELLWAMGRSPQLLFDLVLQLFATKATAVVTNVAGPRTRISIAGAPVTQAMFWVPAAGHLGLGVSLLSYAGEVWLGVQSDAELVPQPERILTGFEAEVSALTALLAEAAA